MARTGRPPKPIEQKRLLGNPGKRRLAESTVVALPRAPEAPRAPKELGPAGRTAWKKIWAQAITWLSPDSDWLAVVETCHTADVVVKARERYMATSEPADMRAYTMANKAYTEALSALGFNPTARARLGVAEVKKIDAIESILARRASVQEAQ